MNDIKSVLFLRQNETIRSVEKLTEAMYKNNLMDESNKLTRMEEWL